MTRKNGCKVSCMDVYFRDDYIEINPYTGEEMGVINPYTGEMIWFPQERWEDVSNTAILMDMKLKDLNLMNK